MHGQKIEKGGQLKEDKGVEEGKKETFLLIFISSTLELVSGEKKNPLRARVQFYSTVFINPDIILAHKSKGNGPALPGIKLYLVSVAMPIKFLAEHSVDQRPPRL